MWMVAIPSPALIRKEAEREKCAVSFRAPVLCLLCHGGAPVPGTAGWRLLECSEGGNAGLVPLPSLAAGQARGSQVQPESQIMAWLMDDAGLKSNSGGNTSFAIVSKGSRSGPEHILTSCLFSRPGVAEHAATKLLSSEKDVPKYQNHVKPRSASRHGESGGDPPPQTSLFDNRVL